MRIKNSDMHQMMYAVTSGNPGDITTLAKIAKVGPLVDPENYLGLGLGGYLLTMDSYGIYDGKLYQIHQFIAEGDPTKTIAILRGLQLGILGVDELTAFLTSDKDSFNFEHLFSEVRYALGVFAPDIT